MKYENIITKDYINEHIRPCTCNDTIFEAAVGETILLDLAPKFDEDWIENIKSNNISIQIRADLENGLRDAIGYYVLARVYRTGSITATKYGVTEKISDDSNPATSAQINANSNYFRQVADQLIAPIVKEWNAKHNTKPNYSTCRIIGD